MFFCVEKHSYQEEKVNKLNGFCLCSDVGDVLIFMSTTFPVTLMNLGIVSIAGDFMPSFSFEKGPKANTYSYNQVINTVLN